MAARGQTDDKHKKDVCTLLTLRMGDPCGKNFGQLKGNRDLSSPVEKMGLPPTGK